MTHYDLVDRAGRWLLNTKRCKLVVVNAKPFSCVEHPDAIGWNAVGESIVVECKVSTPDFRADHYKKWRASSTGMGFYRYFMTPPGLWTYGEPWDGSGLVEVHGRIVRVIHKATPRQTRDWTAEMNLLVSRLSGGRCLLSGSTDITEPDHREVLLV